MFLDVAMILGMERSPRHNGTLLPYAYMRLDTARRSPLTSGFLLPRRGRLSTRALPGPHHFNESLLVPAALWHVWLGKLLAINRDRSRGEMHQCETRGVTRVNIDGRISRSYSCLFV
ncbi:hypothetical protein PHLGIDRAFT_480642 [Phlebiopsis gigantea 11061_1 CR5-6]|uniref:Uncharacterized protein n=1 Tax=Phlebiopsis gigantea (strain 11061_1 CR5-6) TaxID=745531 RepID=A0A0C3S958_PHLG1|nr:hypothetical protein PHLGIDRAFT_480642 [Phlebiopsis gigantea 11061_1 CR5-6]